MAIIRISKNKDNPYTIMSNYHLKDKRLSWKGKGLMSYLLSRPDGWTITVEDLKKRSKSGRNNTESAIKELLKFGYMTKSNREQIKGHDGKFLPHDYDVYEKPIEGSTT